MLKGILIVLAILMLITVSQQGIEKVKTEPIRSSINTTQIIYGYVKSTISNQTEIGMIPCLTDMDCVVLEQCNGKCTCQKGSCFR